MNRFIPTLVASCLIMASVALSGCEGDTPKKDDRSTFVNRADVAVTVSPSTGATFATFPLQPGQSFSVAATGFQFRYAPADQVKIIRINNDTDVEFRNL